MADSNGNTSFSNLWETGQRYFFFKTLLDENHSNNLLYKIGKEASNYINSGANTIINFNQSAEQSQGITLIDQTLTFLEIMEKAERAQEKAYFQDKKKKLQDKQINERITNFFDTKDENSSFDYTNFIITINELYTDATHFKKVVTEELERLNKLQKIQAEFDEWIKKGNEYNIDKSRAQNIKSYVQSELQKIRDLKKQEDDQSTEKSPRQSELEDYLNSRTIGNSLQKSFIDLFEQVWKNPQFKEKLIALLNKHNIKSYESIQYMATGLLIMDFLTECNNIIDNIIDDIRQAAQNKEQKEREQLERQLARKNVFLADQIAKKYFSDLDETSQEKKTLNYLIQQLRDAIDNNQANDFTRLVERLFSKQQQVYINNNGNIAGITDQVRQMIEPILNKVSPQTKKNKGIEKRITTWLQQIKITEGKTDITVNKQEVVNKINDIIRSKQILSVYFRDKDNLLSELFFSNDTRRLAQLTGDIIATAATTDGQKIDVAARELGKIEFIPDPSIISFLSKNLNEILIKSTAISHTPIKIEATNEIFDETKWRADNGFGAGEFSIEAETLRRKYVKASVLEKAKKILEEIYKNSDEIPQLLQTIENSISVGATVKSYDKYEKGVGFHGGSLGGTVENQIKNIQQMLNYGGITISDANWLTIATYNTGPNMIGDHLKNPLEAIFSAAGAMLLFDDAGEQAEYIKTILDSNTQIEETTPRFVHLYHLNNLYIPSSYVLQKTRLAMEVVRNDLIQGKMTAQGVKATINNNVTEDPNAKDPTAFFNSHKEEVTITLTFLSGFLDLVDKINKAIQ